MVWKGSVVVRYLLALSCVCVAQVLRPYFAAAQTDPSKCAKLLMEGAVSYKETTLLLTNAKCLLTDVGRHEVLPEFMRGFQALIAFGRDHKGGPANPEAADEMHALAGDLLEKKHAKVATLDPAAALRLPLTSHEFLLLTWPCARDKATATLDGRGGSSKWAEEVEVPSTRLATWAFRDQFDVPCATYVLTAAIRQSAGRPPPTHTMNWGCAHEDDDFDRPLSLGTSPAFTAAAKKKLCAAGIKLAGESGAYATCTVQGEKGREFLNSAFGDDAEDVWVAVLDTDANCRAVADAPPHMQPFLRAEFLRYTTNERVLVVYKMSWPRPMLFNLESSSSVNKDLNKPGASQPPVQKLLFIDAVLGREVKVVEKPLLEALSTNEGKAALVSWMAEGGTMNSDDKLLSSAQKSELPGGAKYAKATAGMSEEELAVYEAKRGEPRNRPRPPPRCARARRPPPSPLRRPHHRPDPRAAEKAAREAAMPAEEIDARAAKKQKKERTAELAALPPEERKVEIGAPRRRLLPPPPALSHARAPLQRRLPSATGKAISAAKKSSTHAKTIALQLAATTDTVKTGVPPKDAEAAEELSEIFGVKVTVKTIVKYEQAKTRRGFPCFVPSIEGTPFKISPSKCESRLGPQAIRRLHGVP